MKIERSGRGGGRGSLPHTEMTRNRYAVLKMKVITQIVT